MSAHWISGILFAVGATLTSLSYWQTRRAWRLLHAVRTPCQCRPDDYMGFHGLLCPLRDTLPDPEQQVYERLALNARNDRARRVVRASQLRAEADRLLGEMDD